MTPTKDPPSLPKGCELSEEELQKRYMSYNRPIPCWYDPEGQRRVWNNLCGNWEHFAKDDPDGLALEKSSKVVWDVVAVGTPKHSDAATQTVTPSPTTTPGTKPPAVVGNSVPNKKLIPQRQWKNLQL